MSETLPYHLFLKKKKHELTETEVIQVKHVGNEMLNYSTVREVLGRPLFSTILDQQSCVPGFQLKMWSQESPTALVNCQHYISHWHY